MNQARTNMQKQQLKTGGIRSESLLNLLTEIPRSHFVPNEFHAYAYSDTRIPLHHGQTMMTPLEEATILQALDIQKHHTVLEIGTGSGYLTALMAHQAKQVISLEYYSDLTHYAQHKLAHFNYDNISLITGDGIHGYLEKAPYDIIVLTGAIEQLDKCFHPQLLQEGKLFALIGKNPAVEGRIYRLNKNDLWQYDTLFDTAIEPLVDRYQPTSFQF